MNYLIVLPKMTQNNQEWYMFPLGIAYISASLKQAGFNVFCLNLNYKEKSTQSLLRREIEKHNINVVATGGITVQYNPLKDILDSVKAIDTSIITVLGGGFVTADPINAMKSQPNADIGVIGEGEVTVVALAEALNNNKSLKEVQGLIIKKNTDYEITEKRGEVKDLEAVPLPDYEGFEFEEVLKRESDVFGMYTNKIAVLSCSRSCPFNCTFCFHPSGSTYRKRSLDSVFKELDFLVEKYSIKGVHILDELFAADKERLFEFCDKIKKYDIGWWVQMRVTLATKEALLYMKECGCKTITLGIESGDDTVLKSMNKKITVAQIDEAIQNCKEVGMDFRGNLIFGDIAETAQTANNSINWCIQNKLYNNISMGLILIYPGSYLYKYAIENGLIKDPVKYIAQGCQSVNISKMSNKELTELRNTITEVSDKYSPKLNNISITAFNKENYTVDFEGECCRCGKLNKWQSIGIDITGRLFHCVYCGQVHGNTYKNMLAPQFLNNATKNLADICKNSNCVAVWGMGTYIKELFNNYDEVSKLDLLLFDSSKYIRENGFFGKDVLPTEEILNYNPDAVILGVASQNYPQVTEALNDLCKKAHKRLPKIITMGNLLCNNNNVLTAKQE